MRVYIFIFLYYVYILYRVHIIPKNILKKHEKKKRIFPDTFLTKFKPRTESFSIVPPLIDLINICEAYFQCGPFGNGKRTTRK